MSLTEFVNATIAAAKGEIDGKALTIPALLSSDGTGTTYAIDVAIGGQTTPLKNVPIAAAAKEVHYATLGSAVTLKRNAVTGRFEVIGFAKSVPGSFRRFSVNLTTYANGAVVETGLTSRLLTYSELQSYGGGFGQIPYGSYAIFQGSTFLRLGV